VTICQAERVTATLYALMLANSIAMDENLVFVSGGGISGWQAPEGTDCPIAVLISFGVRDPGKVPMILRITGTEGDLFGEVNLPLEIQGGGDLETPSVANVSFNVTVQMPAVRTTTWFRLVTENGEELGAVPLTLQPGPVPVRADDGTLITPDNTGA
jgi:hypothetical protein